MVLRFSTEECRVIDSVESWMLVGSTSSTKTARTISFKVLNGTGELQFQKWIDFTYDGGNQPESETVGCEICLYPLLLKVPLLLAMVEQEGGDVGKL